MSCIQNNILAGASGQGGGGYEIERSLRFNSADSAYLNRTPSAAGNRRTWTWSGWVKRSQLGVTQGRLFGGGTSDYFDLYFPSGDELRVLWTGNSLTNTTAVFRDPSAWYHIVLAVDTTQSTANDRIKLYVNGVLQDRASTNPSQNYDTAVNNNVEHHIGRYAGSGSSTYFNGYLADIHLIDGQALVPTDFGETDDNGVWQPKKFAGTYGTNGFHLPFKDNSSNAALGTDTSGNGNTWTVNNLSAGAGTAYSSNGSGSTNSTRGYDKAFDGSLSTFCEPSDNSTVTFDFTGFSGGGITVSSSLRMYLNKAGSPAAGHFTVNGTNLGGSVPSGAWLTISSVSLLQTITFFHASGSSSVELYAVEVDSTVLVSGSAASQDSLRDSPSQIADQSDTGAGGEVVGNYATLNPLNKHNNADTFSEGNLKLTGSGSGNGHLGRSTIAMSSGKYYWEVTWDDTSHNFAGIQGQTDINYNNSYVYLSNAKASANNGSSEGSSYGASWGNGDVIGIAFDADNATLAFYKNGVSQGTAFTSITGTYSPYPSGYVAFFGNWNNQSCTFNVNFGQRAFAYPVSGYKSLNTANLDPPTIADGSQYFDAKLYTGNGTTGSRALTGLSFSPDFTWLKGRSYSISHLLYDNVRGAGSTKSLVSNGTNSEGSAGDNSTFGYLESFDTNGFSIYGGSDVNNGYINKNNATYASWNWDAGTSTVTNNDGSIASQVRANPSAGFSIVTWTGGGATASIGTGLNAEPHFVIVKNRTGSADNWSVYTKTSGAGKQIYLNTTDAEGSGSVFPTAPTNAVINIGGGYVGSGIQSVAYCFAPVSGYSAMGSYVGNGSADGPFVFTGFRPAVIITKASSATGTWIIRDTARDTFNSGTSAKLAPNYSIEENNSSYIGLASQTLADFLSNGFKVRSTGGISNDSGVTYIYIAFAEKPFKTARAR